jgi:hypothetical protein
MHLGHLKAYWADIPYESKSKEATMLENIHRRILKGHLTLLNYSLPFGYPLKIWKTIVNMMLEKDPGTQKIHRLRVIHLSSPAGDSPV